MTFDVFTTNSESFISVLYILHTFLRFYGLVYYRFDCVEENRIPTYLSTFNVCVYTFHIATISIAMLIVPRVFNIYNDNLTIKIIGYACLSLFLIFYSSILIRLWLDSKGIFFATRSILKLIQKLDKYGFSLCGKKFLNTTIVLVLVDLVYPALIIIGAFGIVMGKDNYLYPLILILVFLNYVFAQSSIAWEYSIYFICLSYMLSNLRTTLENRQIKANDLKLLQEVHHVVFEVINTTKYVIAIPLVVLILLYYTNILIYLYFLCCVKDLRQLGLNYYTLGSWLMSFMIKTTIYIFVPVCLKGQVSIPL